MIRPPATLRTPILLAALLVLHLLLAEPIAALRLRLLAAASRPASWVAPPRAAALAPPPDPAREAIRAAQESALGPDQAARASLLPVLDLDDARRVLLAGGGHDDGVRIGSLASTPAGCIGIVDRVAPHLSRVRLLDAPGSTVVVQVPDPGRALPGDVDALVGTLQGTASGPRLAASFLPESFRKGDRLETVAADGQARPVGIIEEEGIRPRVRLAADPAAAAFVHIAGVTPRDDPARRSAALFEDRALAVLADDVAGRAHAVLVGGGRTPVTEGSAVHASGWYLGRVLLAAGGAVLVERPDARGARLRVDAVDAAGRSFAAIVAGDGRELRLLRWLDAEPSEGRVVLATSGGQELVPPGLVVAEGRWSGKSLEVVAPGRWPAQVLVSVFRHADERRGLLGRRP